MDKIFILTDLCTSNAGKRLFGFLGQMFNIIMIAVPVILIIMGSIDFVKAVISQKDDEMKKAQNMFIKRLIVGVIIFFVPPIVNFVIGLTGISTTSPCMTCFTDPKNSACKVTETTNNNDSSNTSNNSSSDNTSGDTNDTSNDSTNENETENLETIQEETLSGTAVK